VQCDILSSGTFHNNNSTITVKSIFADNNNWNAFQLSEKANLRDVEISEVNKMMTCKDADRGNKLPDWNHTMISHCYN